MQTPSGDIIIASQSFDENINKLYMTNFSLFRSYSCIILNFH